MLKAFLRRTICSRSIWIAHVNIGSCNGCDSEIISMLSPVYSMERFGIALAGSPKHADVLVVTGCGNEKSIKVLENIYEQIPKPCKVIAVGACACSGSFLGVNLRNIKGVEEIMNVDEFVTGCCPTPEKIVDGIIAAWRKN